MDILETPPPPRPTVTMGQLYDAVRQVDRKVGEVRTMLDGAPDGSHPGLRIRLDRLEESERARRWWLRAAVTLGGGAFIGWLREITKGGGL